MTAPGQAIRFLAVGASGTAVNLVAFATACGVGCPPHLASVLAFLTACLHNSVLHQHVTFRRQLEPLAFRTVRYIAVSGLTLLADVAALSLLISAGAPALIGQAAGIALACPLNYLLSSRLVYRQREHHAPAVSSIPTPA
jgi:putative flippase GtrA